MNKKQRIAFKEQSLKKWKRIVKDLKADGKGHFDFGHENCGYCQTYIDYSGSEGKNECSSCPLLKKKLCNGGGGKSYRIVSDWYCYYGKAGDVIQKKVLKQAKIMVRAIKKDLAKETK